MGHFTEFNLSLWFGRYVQLNIKGLQQIASVCTLYFGLIFLTPQDEIGQVSYDFKYLFDISNDSLTKFDCVDCRRSCD